FVVADDGTSGAIIHQYILPLKKLQDNLTSAERYSQPSNPLKAIRFMTLAQRQMARRRSLRPDDATATPEDRQAWMELLYGKWLDPIMAIMAAYELVRTNSFPTGKGEVGSEVISN